MMRKMNSLIFFMTLLGLFMVAGCGGGGIGGSVGGSSTETGNPAFVGGVIQKGPFFRGATVVLKELNDIDLQPTGLEHVTDIVNNLGEFELSDSADISSTYVEIEVTGYYYSEITGAQSLCPITLSAFVDLAMTHEININVLTTIATKRVKYLMVNEGKEYEAAKIQARNEILTIFKIPQWIINNLQEDDADTFIHWNIGQEGMNNAILLYLSIILANPPAESATLAVQTIADEIEIDGALDDSGYIDELYNNAADIDTATIRANLESYFLSLAALVKIPDFEYFFDLYIKPYIKVPAPIFSLPSATYNQDIAVQLYDVRANADIYYTINGGDPILYVDPIEISENQRMADIRAWAIIPDMKDSDVARSCYFIDYEHDAAQYKTDMTIDEYQSGIVGTWVGYIEPPVLYLSQDSVMFSFDENMQYTTQFLSYYYGMSYGLYQVYYGWSDSSLYYGTGTPYATRIIDIYDVYPDGKAVSDILTVYNQGGTIKAGRLDQITMSDDLNHLQFELWSNSFYLPFVVHLTRLVE